MNENKTDVRTANELISRLGHKKVDKTVNVYSHMTETLSEHKKREDFNYLDFCKRINAYVTRHYFDIVLNDYMGSNLSKEEFIENYLKKWGQEIFVSNGVRYVATDICYDDDLVDEGDDGDEVDIYKLLCTLSEREYNVQERLSNVVNKLRDICSDFEIPDNEEYY